MQGKICINHLVGYPALRIDAQEETPWLQTYGAWLLASMDSGSSLANGAMVDVVDQLEPLISWTEKMTDASKRPGFVSPNCEYLSTIDPSGQVPALKDLLQVRVHPSIDPSIGVPSIHRGRPYCIASCVLCREISSSETTRASAQGRRLPCFTALG